MGSQRQDRRKLLNKETGIMVNPLETQWAKNSAIKQGLLCASIVGVVTVLCLPKLVQAENKMADQSQSGFEPSGVKPLSPNDPKAQLDPRLLNVKPLPEPTTPWNVPDGDPQVLNQPVSHDLQPDASPPGVSNGNPGEK